jgi:hypothetical protein
VKVIGELIEGIAGRAGLKNVREVGERMTTSERLLDAAGSDLLDYGQTVIAGLKSTTGEGAAENGEAFGQARAAFDGVNQTLKSAVAVGWAGSGSYAYADQNTRQQLRSQAMADADHEVHKVLYREAAQITLRRGYLDDQYNFLANTSYVTFPLQFIPRYGEAMKLAVEIAALQTALGESYNQVSQLQSEVAQNAAELQQAVGRYSGVADGAELPGAPVNLDPLTDAPTKAGSSPTVTPGETTEPGPQPAAGGSPPFPQLPPLGTLLSPLAGYVTATVPRPRAEKPSDDDDKAASGERDSEPVPLRTEPDPPSDRLQKPVTARLDSDNPPGPPAGTPAQDQR